MKNIIPLVVSVVLGLAAVYIVSTFLFNKDKDGKEDMVSITVAAHNIEVNETIETGALTFKDLPASAVPRNALPWENASLAYGQKLPHAVSEGDYILMTDIRIQTLLSDCAQRGEWMIPVTFSDPALVKMLMPNDEIAIIASYASATLPTSEVADNMNLINPPDLASIGRQLSTARETSVLLPCVRVLGIGNEKGSFRENGSTSGTIFVSLPPQQALILLAAQREAELLPALRKRNDPTALNRKDGGVVNASTFNSIRANLPKVEMPEIPCKLQK